MKKNYILLVLSIFIFSITFSQTTLYSENFGSTTVNAYSLNDLGYSDHNAVSWTTNTYLYFFDHAVDADCDADADWTEASSQHTYYGTAPAGMSSYRAGIKSTTSSCSQNQSLITRRWTATESTMSIDFSYSFRAYGGSGLYVYLQSRSGGGDFSNHTTLVSTTSSASVDYSSTVNVTSGHEYRLVFKYVGTWAYGAAVDTILVRHMPVISGGSDISGLSYATGSGPSTSQSTTVSGLGLAADITLTAPTNFEISTDNSSFSNSLTLSESSGTVSSTTIYARLKTGLAAGLYSGNISCTSTNASTVNIALSGGVGVVNLYVDDSGDDDNNTGLTSGSPFATLSKAITTATDDLGVTINVGAGTYTEHTLNLNKSNITITGAGSTTIFENNTSNKHMMTISASNSTLEKMTIKDYGFTSGASNAYGGGAIRVGATPGNSTTSTTLSGIVFTDILFKDNTTNATSGDGGAIEFTAHSSASTTTTATINGCTFDGNRAGTNGSSTAGHNGAAVMGKEGCRLTINNSIFFDNTVDYAGSVTIWDATYDVATVTINNCTFYDNISYGSVAGYIAGGVFQYGGTATINNSIFWDSDATNSDSFDIDGLYSVINMNKSLIEDYSTTNTSGTVTPDSFTSTNEGTTPLFTDVSSDDYSLQSGSVAIDAGSSSYAPADDINDLSRPQGQADDIGAFEHANTWDGSSSTDWGTAANWSENIVPVSGRSPVIANVTNDPDITTDVSLEDITIESGAILDINSTGSLTLTDDFTNSSGTVNLNSDSDEFSSIIISGSVTGNITYNRYVNTVGTDEWDLIGSPVDGLSISSFVTTNTTSSPATLAINNTLSPNAYAIGIYDNSNNTWTNFTTATVGTAGNFDIGKGYQMASVNGGTGILAFTGTPASTTQTQAIIDNDAANAGAGRRWNLIANPFPSYIQANTNADGTNNFLSVNTDKLDDAYEYIYGYDADGSGYTVYNNTSGALRLAPGQAFMVASDDTSSDNVSFTTAMRTVVGGDDLITGNDNYDSQEVVIKLYNDNTEIEETRFYFKEGLSLDLDPGYDAGHFNQQAALMSRLVEEDQGIGFIINAMGTESMNNAIIPLVINQEAYQDFRVALFTHTIPQNVNVYLEDNQQGTMTLLNEQDFELTPENTLSEVGRFYLHLTEDTFSIEDEVETNLLNVFKAAYNNFITVEGLAAQSGVTNVKLYSILGTEVLSISFNNTTNTQTIPTNGLASGVYVIKLQSGSNQLTKKLIIK